MVVLVFCLLIVSDSINIRILSKGYYFVFRFILIWANIIMLSREEVVYSWPIAIVFVFDNFSLIYDLPVLALVISIMSPTSWKLVFLITIQLLVILLLWVGTSFCRIPDATCRLIRLIKH